MSDDLVRHARSKWEWDSPPSRKAADDAAAHDDPQPAPRSPRHKNTRDFCRGKPGVPHAPRPRMTHYGWRKDSSCGPFPRWRSDTFAPEWWCRHEWVCARCGKILVHSGEAKPGECPDYPGTPAMWEAARAEGLKWETRRERWARKRHPVTGPQHYRRPKPAK